MYVSIAMTIRLEALAGEREFDNKHARILEEMKVHWPQMQDISTW
jgi:hypothetical protein